MVENCSDNTGLIPLSLWRDLMNRGSEGPDLAELLSHGDAGALVQSIPAQDLFYLIKKRGFEDSLELLKLCHPKQLQAFIDLDAWKGDQLSWPTMAGWLEAVMACDSDTFCRLLHGIDPEIWIWLLQKYTFIHDTDEDIKSDPRRHLIESPCNVFLLEIFEPKTAMGQLVERFLRTLFGLEYPDYYHRLLLSARMELRLEVEESAYDYRSVRMSDLGFVDYYDSLELFAYKEPDAPRQKTEIKSFAYSEEVGLPLVYASPLTSDSFFSRVADLIEDPHDVEQLLARVVTLANRLLSAEQVNPGDEEGCRMTMEKVRDILSLGLEYSSGGEPSKGLELLRGSYIADLFRSGYSLGLKLKKRVVEMSKKGWFSLPGSGPERLDPGEREFLKGLRARQPVLYVGVEDPRRIDFRLFKTVQDIQLATGILDRIDLKGKLFTSMAELDFSNLEPEVTFGDLFRTAVLRGKVTGSYQFEGLTPELLGQFLELDRPDKGALPAPLSEDVLNDAIDWLSARSEQAGLDTATAEEIAAGWLAEMESTLEHLPSTPVPDPRFLGGFRWQAQG